MWAWISRSDFSTREAALGCITLIIKTSYWTIDAGCFHYHAQLQTPDVWRAWISVQTPHCPICPVCSASLPKNLLLIFQQNWNMYLSKLSFLSYIKCIYLCFKMFFLLLSLFFFFYINFVVDNDGCRNWIFLVVLLLIEEREPDLLFPVLAHPKSWKVCLPFSAVWLVVFSICIAICKWASVLLSDAQLLLMKQICLWWVANAGKITLFLLWVFHRPKHVPLIGTSVLWLLWGAGAVKRNARQKWGRHLNSSLQVEGWAMTWGLLMQLNWENNRGIN